MKEKVKLFIDGLKAKISNGIINIEFDEAGTVTSLIKNNKELVKKLNGAVNDPDKKHTFYVDYHAEGKFRNMKVTDLKVVKDTEEEAHIKYIDSESMLYIEYNIILKKGESGIYSYVVAKNNLNKEFRLSEFRTVYRLDYSIFNKAYNAERKGLQPEWNYLNKYKKIQDETYEIPDGERYTNGKIYSKYDYAGYFKDNHFWGQYGNGFGFWFIPVSTEYYPSGPLKQELLVHYDSIILNYMTGAHFGTGDFMVPKAWRKLYGPWYVYINEGNDEEVIEDARKKAAAEEEKWPYTWMEETLYPTKRALVTGKLKLTHNRSSRGAVVILAKPGGEIIRQKADYIFYSQVDEKGEFKISNVRAGKYTLYAYSTNGDITDEFSMDNVVVENNDICLGEILWDAPCYRTIWQIGTADRTAVEFKFGSELRNYKWQELVPENLTYIIGKSKENEDWYYAQTKLGDWNIKFKLNEIQENEYWLTIAIASASKGKINSENEPQLTVKVNNIKVKALNYTNDNSIYRSAVKSGWYHCEKIKVDSRLLKIGENTITLTANGAIMYDTILFQSN